MSTWVGVDPGEKRIGVARSDALGLIARPMAVVAGVEPLAALVREWAEERELAGVVVGLPRNMDGTLGPSARRALALVESLRAALPLPVVPWDERLSTRRAEVLAGPGSRGRADAEAAALILQSYLDAGTPATADPAATEEG